MKKIFFLEDEDSVFRQMERLLQQSIKDQELVCEQYRSIEEAEQQVRKPVIYDAFVLNIRVKGSPYTGRYLAALIREQKQHAAVPIIFVSFHPLMQVWLEETLGMCWFIKKEDMVSELPKLMMQIMGLGTEEKQGISHQRLLVKKKESIEIWVMVKDVIAIRSVKRDEIWVYTALEGKKIIRGARGMMALIEEQIFQNNLSSLHFINHGEVINLHFFRSLERGRLTDGRERSIYQISMFGCDETFLPSRQYLQGIRELLDDRE